MADQTVDKAVIQLAAATASIEKVSILKVKWINIGTGSYDYVTVLYEGALVPAPGQISGQHEIPSTSFSVTSISKGDAIYVFWACSTLTDLRAHRFELHTTLD